MGGPTYIRMYPTDWRSGCLGLSLEQEGLYIRVCMFIAETNRRVPLDDSQAARMLGGTNVNQYRKVLGQLLVLGKIRRHDDGYGNDRIEHETTTAKSAAKSGNGSDRKASEGQERKDYQATTQVTTQATYQVTPLDTPPVVVEKIEQNQSPFIEPITSNQIEEKECARAPISMVEGRIVLSAGKRDFWLPSFGNDETTLNLALIQAAGYVQPNDTSYSLDVKVERQLAMIARDRRDRDQRYANQKNTVAAKPASERDRKSKVMWDVINSPEFKAASTSEGVQQ